ncbi:hypothetical protein R5R35_010172 [Gryllus longicercus]|uniref:Uncharacterized protein n=1 Tax=Gryllus longicercus TaxID=2509291 RepID=A0AAN9V7A4_9ORTH
MKAAQDGRIKDVRTLLQQGADANFCNRSKWTPLHVAAMKAQTDVVSLLLEKGANLNARNTYGFTALHLAAKNDYTGLCACFLIYAGCNVDSRNHFGRTALHYAVESNNQAAVRALVVGGARKGLRDHEGRAPYDLAKTEVVKRFVRF